MKTEIRNVKQGDMFTLKPIEEPTESQVWIRDEWDRREKKYLAHKFDDVNRERMFRSETAVYTGFTF